MKSSELFESEIYLEEVSDVMCTAQAGKLTLICLRATKTTTYLSCNPLSW